MRTPTPSRGGYRILRRRGLQPSGGGTPTYDFAKFSEKLHEIEKILGCRGGGPPLDPPLLRCIPLSKGKKKTAKEAGCTESVFDPTNNILFL